MCMTLSLRSAWAKRNEPTRQVAGSRFCYPGTGRFNGTAWLYWPVPRQQKTHLSVGKHNPTAICRGRSHQPLGNCWGDSMPC